MSRVFAIALTLSTAVHLAAVGFGQPASPSPPVVSTVLALTLIPPATQRAAPTPTTPAALPTPRPRATHAVDATDTLRPTATDVARSSLHSVRAEHVEAPSPFDKLKANGLQTSASHSNNVNTAGATESASSDALIQQVQALLSGRFHYPRLARKRGWEGIVEIALNLAADGRITQVQLHRASGHAVLDNAALDSANQLHAVPNAATLLQGRARAMIIPIHYRLRES